MPPPHCLATARPVVLIGRLSMIRYHRAIMDSVHNFSYVVEHRIAGSAHPGYGESLAATLVELHAEGIRAILTLTEAPLDSGRPAEFGFVWLHLPVRDFGAPTMTQIEQAVAFLREHGAGDSRVLVHCAVGYGRTGTILACYLVAEGATADEAILTVRTLRPGSIEDVSQERAIADYERHLGESALPGAAAGDEA